MKKFDTKTHILSVVICLLPIIAGAFFYSRLPEQMPIHWDVNDVPDSYVHKTFALFCLPLIFAAVQWGICWFFRIMIKGEQKLPKIYGIILWLFPALLVLLYTLMLTWALGYTLPIGNTVLFILGLFFIILGNYLPKMSYSGNKNYVHPTPKNEQEFRRILKISGISFIALGIVFLILMFFV